MAEGEAGTAPALSYEQARSELETIVARLESGGTTLEESLALYERGEDLSRVCLSLLQAARARLDGAGEGGAVQGP